MIINIISGKSCLGIRDALGDFHESELFNLFGCVDLFYILHQYQTSSSHCEKDYLSCLVIISIGLSCIKRNYRASVISCAQINEKFFCYHCIVKTTETVFKVMFFNKIKQYYILLYSILLCNHIAHIFIIFKIDLYKLKI